MRDTVGAGALDRVEGDRKDGTRACLLLVAVVALAGGPSGGVTLDAFTTAQGPLVAPPPAASTTAAAEALGGRRGLAVRMRSDGAGPVTASVAGGVLTVTVTDGTPDARGEAVVTWDGDADPAALSFLATPVDLTAGGHRSLRLAVLSADAGAELVLEVYSEAGRSSLAALRLPAVAALTDVFLSWGPGGDFVPRLGIGADFASVGAVVLTVRGTETSVVLEEVATVGPAITASKRDVDLAGDPIITPQPAGSTFKYRVTLTNNGGEAVRVDVSDVNADPHLTLDPSTVRASVLARHDTYRTAGNMPLVVDAGDDLYDCDASDDGPLAGLLANDCDADALDHGAPDATELWVTTTGAVGTWLGGTATVASDGSFSYEPPVGVGNAVDGFAYTVSDNDGSTATATARVVLGPAIWFVDDAGGGGPGTGSGTLADAFIGHLPGNVASPSGTGDLDQPGDVLFFFTGAHSGGLVLEAGQQLLGEGVGLVVDGVTVVPAGSRPTLAAAAGPAITLAPDTVLRGLNVAGTSQAGIVGSAFATATIDAVDVTSAGGSALDLDHGTLVAGFGTLSSVGTAGQPGIDLDTVGGSLSVATTTLTNPTGAGLRVVGAGGASLAFGATTVADTALGAGPTATAIDLGSSPGAMVFFASLTLASDGGAGLVASNAGSIQIGGTTNAVAARGGPALDIDATSLVATFASLASTSSATVGVDLTDVPGSSLLTVVGATTIAAPAGVGVNVDDVEPGASLRFGNLAVTNRGSHGIRVRDHDGALLAFGDVDIPNGLGAGGNGMLVHKSGAGATSSGPIEVASLDVSNTNATVNRSDAGGDGIPDNETHDGHGAYLLDHTGGFTLTAGGVQGNGGVMQNLEGDGIALVRSGDLDVTALTINNIGTSNQAAASVDNAGIWAYGLRGTNQVRDSTISRFQDGGAAGGSAAGISVTNNGVGFTELRVTDTTFFNDDALLGDDAIQLVTNGTVDGSLIVESAHPLGDAANRSDFHHVSGTGVQVIQNGGGTLTTTIRRSTFRDTIAVGGFGGVDLASAGSGVMSSLVEECRFVALYPGGVNNSGVVTLFAGGTVDFDATVRDSVFGSPTQRTSDGRGAIRASTDLVGAVTDFDITITGNTIDDTDREAISLLPRGEAVPAASGRTMDFVIADNTIGATTPVANDTGLGREGIEFVATENAKVINLRIEDNVIVNFVDSSSDETIDIDVENDTTLNLLMRGNTLGQSGSTTDSLDIATEHAGSTACVDLNSANTSPNVAPHGITITETAGTFRIEDIGGAAIPAATVDAFIEARNTGSATVSGVFDSCNSH